MEPWLWFLIWSACKPTRWAGPEECAELSAGHRRDECYAQVLPDLFRKDPERADGLVQREVTDPVVQDFIYLTVTRDIDPSTFRWCERIRETALADRCKVLVSRPHLHRGAQSGPTAPGGRPPGTDLPGMPPPQP